VEKQRGGEKKEMGGVLRKDGGDPWTNVMLFSDFSQLGSQIKGMEERGSTGGVGGSRRGLRPGTVPAIDEKKGGPLKSIMEEDDSAPHSDRS